MTRRHGVMAPPPHDGPARPGLMAADPAAALDHASLAALEFLLHAAPKG
jgi:hypothetical protein